MKFLLPLLMLAGCGAASAPGPSSPAEVEVLLRFNDGTCSGTVVGRHAIMSAAHCFAGKSKLAGVNGQDVRETAPPLKDGRDHIIVFVDATYAKWASIGTLPAPGNRVSLFGHPRGMPTMWREGMVAGNTVLEPCSFLSLPRCDVTLIDIEAGPGDSGAGFFDAQGRVVGVHTGRADFGGFVMTAVLPLAFTPEQLAMVQ